MRGVTGLTEGLGVTKDPVAAAHWFNVACMEGLVGRTPVGLQPSREYGAQCRKCLHVFLASRLCV